jgi:solute carrier family 35 (UDP-sugar transporter), member A1/2/3
VLPVILRFVLFSFLTERWSVSVFRHPDWTLSSWFAVAFVPAALYSVQNMAALLAYQNLDALTFNVLNQTKTLSAALCCYLVMGRTQSITQVFALGILLLSALVMEGVLPLDRFLFFVSSSESEFQREKHDRQWESRHWTYGVLPVMVASFISGLAGALSQKNLQSVSGRNAYFFSMELCLGSVILLSMSLLFSQDGQQIKERGFWHEWTAPTLVPIVTNSVGGIIVGLVTKYAGSVRKGFALIFGILLSGFIQAFLENERISIDHIAGGFLAALSLYLHSANPKVPLWSLKPKAKAE